MRWLEVVVVAGLAVGCADASVSSGEQERAGAGGALGAVDLTVALRTLERGTYVVAELGGGGEVNANRGARGPWETFTLRDLNGGALEAGDPVALRTDDGSHWLSAEGGGGGALHARGAAAASWEAFTLERVAGGGPVRPGDEVALRASSGHYVVAELGGGDVVNVNRAARGPWETFIIELGSAGGGGPPPPPPPPSGSGVRPDDVVLLPPQTGGAVLGTITGYEMSSPCPFADPAKCELPLYLRYDRDDPEWWDILVQELLASRVNVVMAHGRGCYSATSGDSGNGNMCPRLLRHLVDAIDRAGAGDVLRLGMWDDTGAYQGTRTAVDNLPDGTRFDLADRSSWRFFWDHNMQVWFDTVPKRLWYRQNGRPVVAFWSLSSFFFQNQPGNGSALLRDLRARFQARYGENPVFIVDSTWKNDDPTLATVDAEGMNDWFDPNHSVFTYKTWGGAKWGATTPGFRDPDTYPGCGAPCREQSRRHGAALRDALNAGRDARFTLLEGWTDVAESAGYYRSDAWDFPNQYINIVREFADPGLSTLKLEAEAADTFADSTPGNEGGAYRPGALDVGRLREPAGWFVGWTAPGESLTFREVALPCGAWRVTARVASPNGGQSLHVELGGRALPQVEAPNTGSWDDYQLVHLGELRLGATRGDVTVKFDTGGLNLDWVFLKRADASCP